MNTSDGKSEVGSPANPEPNESNSGSVPPSNGQNQSISPNRKSNTNPGRRATGPSTPAGKQRSKYNARKHGIFSRVVVLPNEPRKDYEELLEGLRNSFRPVGLAEELQVEEMAANRWRYRRLSIAEAVELQWNQQGPIKGLRLSLPSAPALDWLIRYEVMLERSFDRTLGQLERLQRMRLQQPVLPPMKLGGLPELKPITCTSARPRWDSQSLLKEKGSRADRYADEADSATLGRQPRQTAW